MILSETSPPCCVVLAVSNPRGVPKSRSRRKMAPGDVTGIQIAGYRDRPDVNPQSNTGHFVAPASGRQLALAVPFYLRTGKSLAKRTTEIVVQFRRTPFCLSATPLSKHRNQPHGHSHSFRGRHLAQLRCKFPAPSHATRPRQHGLRLRPYFGANTAPAANDSSVLHGRRRHALPARR